MRLKFFSAICVSLQMGEVVHNMVKIFREKHVRITYSSVIIQEACTHDSQANEYEIESTLDDNSI